MIMSIGICNICTRQGCTNERKFDSDLTICSAFEESDTDWEKRKFDLAKQLYVMLMGKEFRVPEGVTAKDIQEQFSAQAKNAATVFVEKYRQGINEK